MKEQSRNLAIEEQVDISTDELMQNLRLVKRMSKEERERIIREGYEKIPAHISIQIPRLVMDICNREYLAEELKEVGIDYINMQEEDSRLIRVAITEYFLEE